MVWAVSCSPICGCVNCVNPLDNLPLYPQPSRPILCHPLPPPAGILEGMLSRGFTPPPLPPPAAGILEGMLSRGFTTVRDAGEGIRLSWIWI